MDRREFIAAAGSAAAVDSTSLLLPRWVARFSITRSRASD
jgi:hypothetical protein